MIDITNYISEPNESHTHIVNIDGDIYQIAIPSFDVFTKIISTAIDNDYQVQELIQEVIIPYVVVKDDPLLGAKYMQAIMKRLYNHCSSIAVLSNPENDSEYQYVVCAPFARVNREMLKEIMETYSSLMKYRGIEYTPQTLMYFPLTWDVSTYKDGSEVDIAIAFSDEPPVTLSSLFSEIPISLKLKMNASQTRKAALIDSILMYSSEEIKGDQIKAIELIPLISKDRSRDMSFFLAMGRCLYRIFKGDENGLELWRQASIPEMQDVCDEYWCTLNTTCTYYRIHTLQFWASKDSPKEYEEWNSTSVRAALEASVMATGGILDVALVGYRKNPTLFICDGDDAKEAVFYMFNGIYYKLCGVFTLQNYLDQHVIPEYTEFLRDLSKLADANATGQGGDTSFKEMMQKKIDKCIQIIVKLKSDAYQLSVIKCLMRLFNKPGFDNIRDTNPNLTAFEDCIFDAERKCMRDGIPEDNITCSTGYTFKDKWNEISNYINKDGEIDPWSHPEVVTVLDNIKKIIYDKEKEEVIRREIASLLHASNSLKRGNLISGPTNNGKSALYSWISKAFGETFAPDLPSNLFFSTDAHPGNASPHLEMARFARIAIQSEVDDSMIMNEALLKRWTGNTDKVTYRGLYKSKIKSYVPRSKPTVLCNTFPKINGNSPALRTRLMVVVLDSKFIIESEKDPYYSHIKNMSNEERDQYMKDNHWYWANTQFDEIILSTYQAFMWIIIQDYIKYSGGKDAIGGHTSVPARRLPQSIINDTTSFFIKSNIFMQFMSQTTKRHQDAPGVTLYALYNTYKKWYSDNISRYGYESLYKFESELALMGINHHEKIYYNIIITYE